MKTQVFIEEMPETSEHELEVVKSIINEFNTKTVQKIEFDTIETNETSLNFESYNLKKGQDNFELKMSFSDDDILLREFELLKGIHGMGFTPNPLDIQQVNYPSQETLVSYYKCHSSYSMRQLDFREMFCDLETGALKDFVSLLATLAVTSTRSLAHPVTEATKVSQIGDFYSIAGEDIAKKFDMSIHFEDDIENGLFKRLQEDLEKRLKSLNMQTVVSGRIDPDSLYLQPPDGKDEQPFLLRDWSEAFLGNPLYNLLNFILEFRLFEVNEAAKSIFFEQVAKRDQELSNKLKSQFIDYLNFFMAYQIWEITKTILFIIAASEYRSTNLLYMGTKMKFNTIKDQAKKIIPFFSDYIDKLDKFININQQ